MNFCLSSARVSGSAGMPLLSTSTSPLPRILQASSQQPRRNTRDTLLRLTLCADDLSAALRRLYRGVSCPWRGADTTCYNRVEYRTPMRPCGSKRITRLGPVYASRSLVFAVDGPRAAREPCNEEQLEKCCSNDGSRVVFIRSSIGADRNCRRRFRGARPERPSRCRYACSIRSRRALSDLPRIRPHGMCVGVDALGRHVREHRCMALCRRHRRILREPVRAQHIGSALAGCDHAYRRLRIHRRLGVSRSCCTEIMNVCEPLQTRGLSRSKQRPYDPGLIITRYRLQNRPTRNLCLK